MKRNKYLKKAKLVVVRRVIDLISEELWNGYSIKLKSYINRKVSDKYEAEDIFQEVCYRMIKNESRISEIKNIEAWLHRITSNAIIDYYRSKDRFTTIDNIDSVVIKDDYSPEVDNYNSETASCLLKIAELLPTKDKEAIIESDFNGIQQNLLGEKWGMSNSGAKNRIQRARKKLRDTLYKCCEVKSDQQGNIIEFENKEVTSDEFSCINC